jgi:glycosyltransferase involved in cell wall biosynthesis
MRIAILGSVALPVPPPAQGGTEWIAYFQAKGLSDRGHKVILFAAQGSKKENYELVEAGGGNTVNGSKMALQNEEEFIESSRKLRLENVYLAEVMDKLTEKKDEYDVILNNMRGEAVLIPLAKSLGKPFVNVMHLPLFRDLAEFFKTNNTNIVTISNAQRKGYPDLNYLETIYNCVNLDEFVFNSVPEDYFLMVGSIAPHKNQEGAIRIAKKMGINLVLAGKIGDKNYYERIRKDIDGKQIEWVGELGFEAKHRLYQKAKGFLFPILWEEPFGLVMIESMACGTPVIAFANGAITEVIRDNFSGYIIKDNDEFAFSEAVKNIGKIRREDCRRWVEDNFSVGRMVEGYERALLRLV